jgi:hypothetical protein
MTNLSWVTCDGGPHLLIAEELATLWEGSDPPSRGRVVHARFRSNSEPGAVATDYDAACDVDDLVGVIPVGQGAALVLGDEVPMSTWVPSTLFAGGLLVVPMTWPSHGMPEDRLLATVNSVEHSDFTQTGLTLPSSSGRFILCSAADAEPNWMCPTARVTVPGVAYQILSAEVRTQGFWLRLHALESAS